MNDSILPPSIHAPASPANEPAIGPALLLRAVRKHWVVVLVSLVVVIIGALGFTSRQVKIYQATATVQFDPQPLMPLGVQQGAESGPDSFWSNQEYFSTQHQVLTSRKVAALVVTRLSLQRDAAFVAGAPPGQKLPSANFSIDGAAELLRSRLVVKPIADSRLVTVSYRDADPERAQRILNAVVDVYVDQNLDATLDSANKRAEWLDTQLVKLKDELESQEMNLHDFKKRNNLLSVSFDDQSNMLRAEIQQLNTNLTELKTRKEHVASRLAVLQNINPEDPALIPQAELLGNSGLNELRTAYVSAKQDNERLLALGKGDNHPEVRAAQAAMKSTRGALFTELSNIREGVATDLQAVQRELSGVSTLYESAKSQAMGLNINEVRFTRLRRTKDNTERVFGLVLERSTESGLSKLMPFNNVRVLDRPLKPGGPVSPRPLMNLAIGTALGLLLGLVGAVSRELLDRTIRSAEDAEQELGLASLGSLPEVSGRAGRKAMHAGYYGRTSKPPPEPSGDGDKSNPEGPQGPLGTELLVHTHPKSAAAEAARAVRTNLLFMSPDRPYRTLLVTSAGPAEGKTTIATSIAIAMSQTGQRVCLVDCDLRRPRIHSLFGQTLEKGLTTALVDASKLDDAIHKTSVPDLWLLASGPTPPSPADLMHSVAFSRLLDMLKERFDRVVIDSPPVCLVTDAVVASTKVDATILVVRARKTRRDGAKKALRALRDVGANLPGFVLNAVVVSGESYKYSYYHPYGQSGEAES